MNCVFLISLIRRMAPSAEAAESVPVAQEQSQAERYATPRRRTRSSTRNSTSQASEPAPVPAPAPSPSPWLGRLRRGPAPAPEPSDIPPVVPSSCRRAVRAFLFLLSVLTYLVDILQSVRATRCFSPSEQEEVERKRREELKKQREVERENKTRARINEMRQAEEASKIEKESIDQFKVRTCVAICHVMLQTFKSMCNVQERFEADLRNRFKGKNMCQYVSDLFVFRLLTDVCFVGDSGSSTSYARTTAKLWSSTVNNLSQSMRSFLLLNSFQMSIVKKSNGRIKSQACRT